MNFYVSKYIFTVGIFFMDEIKKKKKDVLSIASSPLFFCFVPFLHKEFYKNLNTFPALPNFQFLPSLLRSRQQYLSFVSSPLPLIFYFSPAVFFFVFLCHFLSFPLSLIFPCSFLLPVQKGHRSDTDTTP